MPRALTACAYGGGAMAVESRSPCLGREEWARKEDRHARYRARIETCTAACRDEAVAVRSGGAAWAGSIPAGSISVRSISTIPPEAGRATHRGAVANPRVMPDPAGRPRCRGPMVAVGQGRHTGNTEGEADGEFNGGRAWVTLRAF